MRLIKIEAGWDCLSTLLASIYDPAHPKKVMIVTDDIVANLHLDGVYRELSKVGWGISFAKIEAGEVSKDFKALQSVLSAFYEARLDRRSLVAALGGGVVSDLAGFAAAIYMRGIDYINLPTTLLAMADSSIGGKTGIDLHGAKNLVGAFHQPRLTYANICTLKTLPKKDFISGLAEIIKCGIIKDKDLLDYMLLHKDEILNGNEVALTHVIRRATIIKSEIVQADEKEVGFRQILNFGHTYGHAIESLFDFDLPHGHAVAIGMAWELDYSVKNAGLDPNEANFAKKLIESFGLPTSTTASYEKVYALMLQDKKTVNGKIKIIQIPRLGESSCRY